MNTHHISRARFAGLLLVPLMIACGDDPAGPATDDDDTLVETATYRVTFDAMWSPLTHPIGFPPGPHFSGLVGAAHGSGVSFWTTGGTATTGIRVMAETGSKAPLLGEVETAIAAGTAFQAISGGGVGTSPGMVSVEFTVNRDFPLVTVVSMIAPSPDWFVGVHGMSLLEAGAWTQEVTVQLLAYDAGTDSGTTYTALNEPTQPQGTITRLDAAPFDNGTPIGTFTFRRIS